MSECRDSIQPRNINVDDRKECPESTVFRVVASGTRSLDLTENIAKFIHSF